MAEDAASASVPKANYWETPTGGVAPIKPEYVLSPAPQPNAQDAGADRSSKPRRTELALDEDEGAAIVLSIVEKAPRAMLQMPRLAEALEGCARVKVVVKDTAVILHIEDVSAACSSPPSLSPPTTSPTTSPTRAIILRPPSALPPPPSAPAPSNMEERLEAMQEEMQKALTTFRKRLDEQTVEQVKQKVRTSILERQLKVNQTVLDQAGWAGIITALACLLALLAGHYNNETLCKVAREAFPDKASRIPEPKEVPDANAGHFRTDSSLVEKELLGGEGWIPFKKSVTDTLAAQEVDEPASKHRLNLAEQLGEGAEVSREGFEQDKAARVVHGEYAVPLASATVSSAVPVLSFASASAQQCSSPQPQVSSSPASAAGLNAEQIRQLEQLQKKIDASGEVLRSQARTLQGMKQQFSRFGSLEDMREELRSLKGRLAWLEGRITRLEEKGLAGEVESLAERAETALTMGDPSGSSYPLPLAQAISEVCKGPGGAYGLDPRSLYEHAQASNHPRFRPDPRQSAFETVIAELEAQVKGMETGSKPQVGSSRSRALQAEAKRQSRLHHAQLTQQVNSLLSAADHSTPSAVLLAQQTLSPPPCESAPNAALEAIPSEASSPSSLPSDIPATLCDPPALAADSIAPSMPAASSTGAVSGAKPPAAPVLAPTPQLSIATVLPSDSASVPHPSSLTSSTTSSSTAPTADTSKASKKTEANRKKKARQKKNKASTKEKEEEELHLHPTLFSRPPLASSTSASAAPITSPGAAAELARSTQASPPSPHSQTSSGSHMPLARPPPDDVWAHLEPTLQSRFDAALQAGMFSYRSEPEDGSTSSSSDGSL
ncbi:hypothetical protein JCM10213v2_008821 [Rhodosporidiobolus nylandii]